MKYKEFHNIIKKPDGNSAMQREAITSIRKTANSQNLFHSMGQKKFLSR